jgi:hypothetical protein
MNIRIKRRSFLASLAATALGRKRYALTKVQKGLGAGLPQRIRVEPFAFSMGCVETSSSTDPISRPPATAVGPGYRSLS